MFEKRIILDATKIETALTTFRTTKRSLSLSRVYNYRIRTKPIVGFLCDVHRAEPHTFSIQLYLVSKKVKCYHILRLNRLKQQLPTALVDQLKEVKKEFRKEIEATDRAVVLLYNENVDREWDEYQRKNELGRYSYQIRIQI